MTKPQKEIGVLGGIVCARCWACLWRACGARGVGVGGRVFEGLKHHCEQCGHLAYCGGSQPMQKGFAQMEAPQLKALQENRTKGHEQRETERSPQEDGGFSADLDIVSDLTLGEAIIRAH